MNFKALVDFLYSIAILLSLGLLYDYVKKEERENILSNIIAGAVISLIGILIMSTPWEFSTGYFFDPRTVLMGITGLFFGTGTTVIAMVSLSVFRIIQGGGGVVPGILWVVIPTFSALIWRKIRPQKKFNYNFGELFLFGLIIHLLSLAALFTLPREVALLLIRNVAIPVLLIFPAGTAALGSILVNRLKSKQFEIEITRLATVIDQLDEKVIITDLEGHPLYLNNYFQKSTGFEISDVLGQKLGHLKSGYQDDKFYKNLWSTISSGKTWRGQIINKRKDETLYYDEATIFPISNKEGGIINYASFQRDITEQIKMRELMIENEKMLSVGGLAAGMAHEINNPLAGMMQTAEVMANRLGRKTDFIGNVNEAEKAGTNVHEIREYMEARGIFRMIDSLKISGMKIADIVENMVSFSQEGTAEKRPHQMAELLNRTLGIAENDFELKEQYSFQNISVKKDYQEHLPSVLCKSPRIQQVFLNILRNSAQAMQEAKIKDPKIILSLAEDKVNKVLQIEFKDNGPGISAEVKKHIFEPFFTTKQTGAGVGLGLTVSYFIIKEEHKGQMLIDSQNGMGTTVRISLPFS